MLFFTSQTTLPNLFYYIDYQSVNHHPLEVLFSSTHSLSLTRTHAHTGFDSPAIGFSGMATDPPEGYGDDFLEQILAIPGYNITGCLPGNTADSTASEAVSVHHHQQQPVFPLGLSLDNGRESIGAFAGQQHLQQQQQQRERGGSMNMGGLFPQFDSHSLLHNVPQGFQGQPTSSTAVTVPHPPTIRPRVRARRGQATDPHSIAERLRRERIAERMRALQELVPSCNKTDKAAMLDEILDYVKFLRLQVKVLSMSRLGGAGAVAQLVSDVPLQSVEGDGNDNGQQAAWENWSNDDTEREVAKLMEEDVGAAMQFLQSKALCIMPISLASLIYPNHQPDSNSLVKPEPSAPS